MYFFYWGLEGVCGNSTCILYRGLGWGGGRIERMVMRCFL